MIVIALAAMAAVQAPADDPARTAAAAQAMYQQSCQVRAYGSYDDLCNALRRQLRDAEKAARKAQKNKAVPAVAAVAEPVAEPVAQPEPAAQLGAAATGTPVAQP